ELVSKWAADRADAMANEAKEADKRVEDYVRSHNIPQVQGSPASSFQYVKDQEQLTAAQQRYAHAQASLELLNRFGAQAAPETLESKTIQQYRASEAHLLEKMATLTSTDPRRGPLEHGLESIRSQIAAETGKFAMLIRQKAEVAHAELQTIQQVVEADSARAQVSTTEDTVLSDLKHDAETKRQVGIALRTSANDQARIAASQLPPARILFGARTLPSYNIGLFATVLGFVGGIVAAGATIILRRAFSAKIRDTQAITAITGLRAIGSLPEITDSIWRKPSPAGALIAETLRAMSLTMLPGTTWSDETERYLNGNGRAILVTSSDRGEGKTTVAATLARLMAADGFRLLLIDADLRRPRLAAALHSDTSGTTLEAILNGDATLADVLHQDPVSGVYCVFAKARCSNPHGTLGSRNFSEMLKEARRYFDFIILDSPPVLRVADALIVSKLADYVLFLVGAERVTAELVAETIDRFPGEERHKIHPVLTRVSSRDLERRDHYGGYMVLTS
ncbi:MAG: AAA family ATPase, partial [Acetobacteraceae bacterium]|nr:AAA family ATPase [Acetobacteraceae bacterium]